MQDYKELIVWQKSHELVLSIYELLRNFPKDETFNLISQLKRASTSIPTNIAEGAGRFTQKDFASYLQVALGSSHEVEYLILLSKDLGFLSTENNNIYSQHINEIKAMLISLIKKVRTLNDAICDF
ncbi:four helix bundle protein [Mucilaginibacter pallidiroseus]|uniref:Four helix bundle protein n=1 Tax=Mucilaginibacter pallidiroseus TaxID=2599295 RepID=A0A563UIU8_9SPHI|nr:four helix bundle protein [Mucilaginibacter pallidiroseus]TWR31223.1 four helix bundle protein [Mucilaginibacter pallidiroseus]